MSIVMTFEEIKNSYDGQWVLIAYTETNNDDTELIKGKVLAHSSEKSELYQYLESITEENISLEYMGQANEDINFLI